MLTIKTNINQFKKSNNKRIKVLLNAGGGVFGYIITHLMASLDFNLYQKVDVVSGTSIGRYININLFC